MIKKKQPSSPFYQGPVVGPYKANNASPYSLTKRNKNSSSQTTSAPKSSNPIDPNV